MLWDLDGTLADSRDMHWRAWRETLAGDGIALTREQFLASFGQRNDAILGRWLGAAAPPERITSLGDAKEERFRALVAREGLPPLAGADEWVRRLAAAGWRQAIASSAPRRNVVVMVRALDLERHFGALVAAEDVATGKPDPQVFLTAAARLEVPPPRCVVVEDAAAGIAAARHAGMRSIGVGTPPPDGDIAVTSLADLQPDAFDRLLSS